MAGFEADDQPGAAARQLAERYPQVSDKAIVDFVNGLEVVDDLVRSQEAGHATMLKRVFSILNGSSAKTQVLLDQTVNESLRFIKEYILADEGRQQSHEVMLEQLAGGIGRLADRLRLVSGETGQVNARLQGLSVEVASLREFTEERVRRIDERILNVESWMNAKAEMDAALSEWQLDDMGLSPEQSLWLLLNRLRWGHFGAWVDRAVRSPEQDVRLNARNMLAELRARCIAQLREKTGRGDNALVARPALAASLAGQDEARELMAFLSDRQEGPVTCLMHRANSGDTLSVDEGFIPHVFSNASIVDALLAEFPQSEARYGK